ncbi:uncharacterized protein [Choristoneura fumiferana]|uniref:uncharacterized protein n=1 Tax=Choristoneura fumiferana TaxID=7141 RepID=UPI003D15DFED
MMPKASSKFLLHIRLTLKNESRIEKFFQYFRHEKLKTALKWLPKCPLSVIEDAVEKHASEISPNILKRLCERSSTVLEIFVKSHNGYKTKELKAAMILLRSDPEKYLDALNTIQRNFWPEFGKKKTEIVMKKCPNRFIDNFEKFMYNIDLDTFAKYLKKEDIKSFILKQLENKETKFYFNHDRILNFIKYMPKESKFEFTKQFIERKHQILENDCYVAQMSFNYCSGDFGGRGASNFSVYRWYKYAPFGVAFPDLKKMIRTESNPDERNAMLLVLVTTARRNLANIHSLLQYYRDRHINEPFRFKVQFINDLLHKSDTHLYDDKMWAILDEIFRSMEVYIESENNVQTCLKSIIVHKVIRDQAVPEIVEQKFNFDSLNSLKRKLNDEQKDKVFTYLYNLFLNKLNSRDISNHVELAEYVELFQQGLYLLKDWKKDLVDFPVLIDKIKYCAKIKKEKGWITSLTPLYDTKKSWRKNIFDESLVLSPSQIVCMNALKHDPELLVRNKDEVEALRFNDAISMKQVLRKLRVYWPQTMANEWLSSYRERLVKTSGHKAAVRGICSLLTQQQLIEFLKKYEPHETKINWADTDELELSICKNIAQSMHIARPQIKPEAVLAYAKGDYVQFTQPSLNAILHNIQSSRSREYVLNLLNNITSLQKHGIYLAFTKLSPTEMKQIFLDVWKSNKNSSVRAALFQSTHELLCREQDEALIAELWELMQIFMDSLTAEENKTIFNTFGKLARVHHSIKSTYCMKSYRFLKSLPPKADCKNIIGKMKEEMNNIIEELDSDFVADIILEFVDQIILKKSYGNSHRHDMQLLVSYLLSADDDHSQHQRFEKALVPLMEKSIASWDKVNERSCYVRQNFESVLDHMYRSTIDFAFKRNKVKPVALYSNILAKLEASLPVTQNYLLFKQLQLTIAFIDKLCKNTSDSETTQDWDSNAEKQYIAITSDFGEVVARYLKEDTNLYGMSVYRIFSRALDQLLDVYVGEKVKVNYLKNWLGDEAFVAMYLLVIMLMDNYYDDYEPNEDIIQVHKMLVAHPVPEVQIHYYNKFGDNPMLS